MSYVIHCGDCLEVMRGMESNSVDAIVTDPPYYRVKSNAWDKQWGTPAAFIAWIGELCEQWHRILKPNGSLYCFASPKMAARVELAIGERFEVLNRIVWRKNNGTANEGGQWSRANKDILRQFFTQKEEIIFAEHYGADNIAKGAAGYAAKCDELRGFVFEPLRAYLDGERIRAGVSFEDVRQMVGCAAGSGLPSHWFTASQWALPTAANYAKLRDGFNATGGDYLRREYDDLRREYDDLRRPFAVTADVPYTDVWDFPTVPAYKGKHPCEKPQPLLRHIISTSTRPGAVVFDPFAGSGAHGVAALSLGRKFIGCEMSAQWAESATARLKAVAS